jgi:hypothetical protein
MHNAQCMTLATRQPSDSQVSFEADADPARGNKGSTTSSIVKRRKFGHVPLDDPTFAPRLNAINGAKIHHLGDARFS